MTALIWKAALRRLAPLACAITLMMPIVAWFISTGNPIEYLSSTVPPGQTFYVLSKAFGLVTIALLWLQVMSALAKDAPVLRGFIRLDRSRHALLGVCVIAAACTHAALFIAASSLRTGHAAFDLLLPTLSQGFYRTYVSLGAVAFWILIVVALTGWRRSLGHGRWRWIHRLSFVVFSAAFMHGAVVGSETRFGLVKYVYAFMALSLGAGLISRLWADARRGRVAQGAAHAPALHE